MSEDSKWTTLTVFHWVQRYAPEINKRIRLHLKMSGTSYRVGETYVKVGKTCKYLYRAVDKEGQTIKFMLSAKCDVSAAKRFFKKMLIAWGQSVSVRGRASEEARPLFCLSSVAPVSQNERLKGGNGP